MAAIKQLLCVYSEAIKEYQLILEQQPDYVPALKGKKILNAHLENRGESAKEAHLTQLYCTCCSIDCQQ